jgi:hypothetical protein
LSMKARGSLPDGAKRINETIRRSIAPLAAETFVGRFVALLAFSACVELLAFSACVDVEEVAGTVGALTLEELCVSVTIRIATCVASSPLPATRSATRNPLTRRLHIKAAGRRRRLEKLAASRHGVGRGISSTGSGRFSNARLSGATS